MVFYKENLEIAHRLAKPCSNVINYYGNVSQKQSYHLHTLGWLWLENQQTGGGGGGVKEKESGLLKWEYKLIESLWKH